MTTNNWYVSDEITLDAADWSAGIAVRADNAGTPASGDQVEVRVLYTNGDVDNGGGANDYPTMNTSGATGAQGNYLCLLDTYSNYDPDQTYRAVDATAKGVKLAARAYQGATRNITLAARLITHRGAVN